MSGGTRLAIRLMVAQGLLFAAETAAIHQIGGRVPLMLLGSIRALAGVALAIVLGRGLGVRLLRSRQLPLQLLRGGIGFLNLWMLLYSFAHLPFADATAISYTQSAYIVMFSALIVGEQVTATRWVPVAAGIAGALLIAKPAFAGWDAAYLVAACGALLNGLGFVLNKYVQREDNEQTTLFYTNLVPALATLPSLAGTSLPAAGVLMWLPAVFLLGPLGMYAGIVAVRHASAAMLAPYMLLRLVIALAAGVAIFGELPDLPEAIGALTILASCVLGSAQLPWRRTLRHAARRFARVPSKRCHAESSFSAQ